MIVSSLREQVKFHNFKGWASIVIQPGTTFLHTSAPEEVAEAIHQFSSELILRGVQKVVICQLLYRGRNAERRMTAYNSHFEYTLPPQIPYILRLYCQMCELNVVTYKL